MTCFTVITFVIGFWSNVDMRELSTFNMPDNKVSSDMYNTHELTKLLEAEHSLFIFCVVRNY